MDLLLSKAEAIRNSGRTSGITYLRRGKLTAQNQLQSERGVRICERSSPADPGSVEMEGQEVLQHWSSGSPAACGIAHGEAAVPLQPWRSRDPEEPTPEQVDAPEGSHGKPILEQDPGRSCAPVERGVAVRTCDPWGTHTAAACS
ncbi:hypothetical protein TURU_144037 [Turdus rufiventris]|nr:hypothetical protein TURU_144037 [Turdus rufiventris]